MPWKPHGMWSPRGGKIIVLTDLNASPGPGVNFSVDNPPRGPHCSHCASKPSLICKPPLNGANAADWARIYLLSRLDAELVEDLFAVALKELAEVERLLTTIDECARDHRRAVHLCRDC